MVEGAVPALENMSGGGNTEERWLQLIQVTLYKMAEYTDHAFRPTLLQSHARTLLTASPLLIYYVQVTLRILILSKLKRKITCHFNHFILHCDYEIHTALNSKV
jgi:hypothetical protein